MKKLFLSVAICLAGAACYGESLTIATGKPNGGYDRRAKQIAERLSQRGIATTVENKNGSDEISLAVCGGRAQVGLMQIDAIYARALEGCTVKPVAVYGEEIAVILFPPKSPYDQLSDLSAKDAVMVDTIGSGTELYWRTITKIEMGDDGSKDAWAQARVSNDPLELANASAEMGDVQALVLVRKDDSPDITRLLDLGWTLGELWDRNIDNLQFNGTPLYTSEKRKILYQGYSQKVWGYGVRSFVVVSNDIANGDRSLFAAITGAAQ